jgi:hypothetical protein
MSQSMLWESERILSWFSCGAASAVAAYLAIKKFGDRVTIVNCDTTNDEHPDNQRFRDDVSNWLDREIVLLKSDKYSSVDDVFEKTRFMSSPYGARCTTELKKVPRFKFQQMEDIHTLGYTVDEKHRTHQFMRENPELNVDWLLIEQEVSKTDCFGFLKVIGIRRPAMYDLGFQNANCIGCVKSSSPKYWNMIRLNFPEHFERRAMRSRELGVKLVKYKNTRIFLDELPATAGLKDKAFGEDIECGAFCSPTPIGQTAESDSALDG